MDEDLLSRITGFFDFWRSRVLFIENLDHQTNNYEANILIWSCLDALSNLWAKRIGKSNCKKLGARLVFDEFLAYYYGDMFQKVSLPDIWHRIDQNQIYLKKKNSDCKCDIKLPDEAVRLLNNLQRSWAPIELELESNKLRNISDDLDIKNILTKFDHYDSQEIDVIKEWLMFSRYGAIAYKEMRNSYIHEGRSGKGAHGFELHESELRPTYLSYVYTTPPKMGFSVQFMLKVLDECITSFEKDAMKLEQDPAPSKVRCINLNLPIK
jgi:hypothetical protein